MEEFAFRSRAAKLAAGDYGGRAETPGGIVATWKLPKGTKVKLEGVPVVLAADAFVFLSVATMETLVKMDAEDPGRSIFPKGKTPERAE